MTRLQTLKKLESTLEQFLTRVVKLETDQIETLKSIDTLDDIAQDSLRGRFVNNRLVDWIARNRTLVEQGRLKKSAISAVGNLLTEINKGLDTSDPESKKLSDEIEGWRFQGVVPLRRLVLTRKPENRESDLAELFSGMLGKEAELLVYYLERGDHILSILDDVLKSAGAKFDPMFLHLAGSIIYFLKNHGYKIEPYARKLRELEKTRAGNEYA